ncbi:MAG: indole-3-glycerol phosphate synthase TrpC [Candidatus Brocadiaceae bacterium]|jgi:indole-3-glycerol phosphate synthase
MPDILARICSAKRREIEELRHTGRQALGRRASRQEPPRGFRRAILARADVALIAEVKKASPSAGLIREDFDPVRIARAYKRGGAACVSVLTDRDFFQGNPSYLERIHAAVELPLLRKDFILDELQVLEARALGADACLLIAAALEPDELRRLRDVCTDLSMDALVEVHTEAELEAALEAGADPVGINNRDLRTFQVDLGVTERLAPAVPEAVALVTESGISTRADVERVRAAGVDAVLVGESLMRAAEIEAATAELMGA